MLSTLVLYVRLFFLNLGPLRGPARLFVSFAIGFVIGFAWQAIVRRHDDDDDRRGPQGPGGNSSSCAG